VNKHLYLCHPLVLSSPTLMMHGHMNLKSEIAITYMLAWGDAMRDFAKIRHDPRLVIIGLRNI